MTCICNTVVNVRCVDLYDRSRSIMKYKSSSFHRSKINHKIKNIKALDRAIFNTYLKVNSMFDEDYKELQMRDNRENDQEYMQRLTMLKKQWEKELLYMYFEEDKQLDELDFW